MNLSSMEAPHVREDVAGSHSSSSTGDCGPYVPALTRRKRTKRRQGTAGAAAPVPSSSSTNSSLDFSEGTATAEDEDMAHCLILLAQGPRPRTAALPEKFTSRRFNETATTAGGKAGFYVYECKTCGKCFPTFQALGGHRASHKKPKIAAADQENRPAPTLPTNPSAAASAADATNVSNYKLRVHECSICGAEFSSGQALGGHMRRHRPLVVAPPTQSQEINKLGMINGDDDRNGNCIVLPLDLNLPAPSDETSSNAAGFAFAASTSAALVDCHY